MGLIADSAMEPTPDLAPFYAGVLAIRQKALKFVSPTPPSIRV